MAAALAAFGALAIATVAPSTTRAQAFGFGGPEALNTNAAGDAGLDDTPAIATDGAGNWVAVWRSTDDLGGTIGTDQDILVARSSDQGASWSAPAPLNSYAGADISLDASQRVATDGAGNWVAVWHSADSLGGTIGVDFDILVSRSTDNGATWTAAAALNSNAASDGGTSDLSPSLATDGAGVWVCGWQISAGDADLRFARSTDNGATWSPQAPLNTNDGADLGGDGDLVVAAAGGGAWLAAWSSTEDLGGTIGTDQDILFARSTDGGASWSSPAVLNSNATSAGSNFTPFAAFDGAGNGVALWASSDSLGATIGADFDILAASSSDGGATWSAVAPLNSNAGVDAGNDFEPSLATNGAGHWLALWRTNDTLGGTLGSDTDILVALSEDDGASWSAAAALAGNATTDAGGDITPRVATDGGANWVAVWLSTENLGGVTGTEGDILFSTSSAVPVEVSGAVLE